MERLTVKNLGPLKDFTLETNRLTVIIGPQASGKSLLAQALYLFRGLESLLAEEYPYYAEELDKNNRQNPEWEIDLFLELFSRMRGAHFANYIGADSRMKYQGEDCYEFNSIRHNDLNKTLSMYINKLYTLWGNNKTKVTNSKKRTQIFIPTERSLYSRLSSMKRSFLYEPRLPLVFLKFVDDMETCGRLADNSFLDFSKNCIEKQTIRRLGRAALDGTVVRVRTTVNSYWGWKLNKTPGDEPLALEAASSGQLETWPFYILAEHFGGGHQKYTFYFEEPETHLHPRAQVEVIRTIAYLISLGHRFVITTHSPFILYIINTLIQAHIAYDGDVPEGEFSIDPGHVAAYSLGDKAGSIVNPETRLLDLTEIDSVFDEINVSFGKYMDMEFAKHEK